ncbi:trimethylamine methyltransferase family protein [Kiloniella majae]|uniref:trimethylamine methyltransferase family protein n=1 Tax=Kiloniella majae TaxID=1938558 RepID=UPI0015C51F81|nr:trimethylamine methyltransferase family protein [Kiloniella majae]
MARRPGRRNRESQRTAENKPSVAPAGAMGGRYKPLLDQEVDRIFEAALIVLERTGIEVTESPCRETFRKAGCRIDSSINRVFIPPELVEKAMSTMANEVLLAGRTPEHDLNLGSARVYMGTGGQAVKMLDLNGNVRETITSDNYHIGRLVDKLDNIHFYMRPVVCRDLENEDIDVNQFYACLAATNKHVMANSYLPERVKDLRTMANMISGGAEAFNKRPIISFTACWTVSPLRYAMETVEVLDQAIEHDIPVVISSAPQAGATSPAALAGTLVQLLAEQLSGIVYVNLIKPGFPLIMGCVPAQADLRTGAFTGGSGEFSLLNAACAQISQHLRIPIYNSSGISDSKIPDAQAGAEKSLTGLAAALAGSNYIHHSAGFLESLLTVAYEQYVIDNDINGAIMRMVRGIEVTDQTLSVDVIHDVCTEGPNHFLGHAQTLDLMNTEYLYPQLMDRATRDDWEASGEFDLRQTAIVQAKEFLGNHWPQTFTDELDNDLRKQFNILLPKSEMQPDGFWDRFLS